MSVALLDLDGTLIDSGPTIFAAARHALAELGLPEPADMRAFVGPPLPQGMQEVLGVPAALVDQAIELYRAHQLAHLAETPVYEGVVEMCEELRSRGWTLAVATSKYETVAVETLEVLGIQGLFDVVAGGDAVSAAKDVVISRALSRLPASVAVGVAAGGNTHPGNPGVTGGNPRAGNPGGTSVVDGEASPKPIMVGDRYYDVEGARAHGLPVVYAAWGYGTPEEGASADVVAEKPLDLVEILTEMAGTP